MKRKQLKNIASGILGSFISRNNDVLGYWGIGKLYLLMENHNTYNVSIDLLNKTIFPFDKEFEQLVNNYSESLIAKLYINNVDLKFVSLAQILITAYPRVRKDMFAPHKMHCKVQITDDLGNEWIVTTDTWCRKRNPKLEFKSERKY